MVLAASCKRDVTNDIELPVSTEWEPEQDLSQDAQERRSIPRVLEERSRGTYVEPEGT
jgi:hypothetical protein